MYDGTPYEVKVSRTVWSRGKGGGCTTMNMDVVLTKPLPIAIIYRRYNKK